MALVKPLKIQNGIVQQIPTGDDIELHAVQVGDSVAQSAHLLLKEGQSASASAAGTGRIRYDGSTNKLQGSENGGAWTDLISASGVTTQQATATTTTSTTSTADTLMTGMSITPGAGTYIVLFSTSLSNNSNNTQTFASVYAAGTKVAASERQYQRSNQNITVPMATQTVVTVGDAEAIEVRWRVSGGTASALERELTLIEI